MLQRSAHQARYGSGLVAIGTLVVDHAHNRHHIAGRRLCRAHRGHRLTQGRADGEHALRAIGASVIFEKAGWPRSTYRSVDCGQIEGRHAGSVHEGVARVARRLSASVARRQPYDGRSEEAE